MRSNKKPQPTSKQIIVVGAGVAGLAAAERLGAAGFDVTVFEARERIGGRIFTVHDQATGRPVELGAEFVHGKPTEILSIARKHRLKLLEVSGEQWRVDENGQLRNPGDFFAEVDQVLRQMKTSKRDRSFLEFIERCCPRADQERVKKLAAGYIEGFNAARLDQISVNALVREQKAEEEIDGDRGFRIVGGYQRLVDAMCSRLDRRRVKLLTGSAVKSINWRRGEVSVNVLESGRQGSSLEANHVASAAIITLPLGVLQTSADEAGYIRFDPQLPRRTTTAITLLRMGQVMRVTLAFRESFWEQIPARGQAALKNLSFLFSSDPVFPTWWTQMPEHIPIITGWSPSDRSARLWDKPLSFVVEEAVAALSRLVGVDRSFIEKCLISVHAHDWNSDPFARGAYSYVGVGGNNAQRQLAEPVARTLYFAGEATEFEGHHGTVHGAIASGYRAAKQVVER